ncbi:unnamed protein product, partial [Pleuronectes platessa]
EGDSRRTQREDTGVTQGERQNGRTGQKMDNVIGSVEAFMLGSASGYIIEGITTMISKLSQAKDRCSKSTTVLSSTCHSTSKYCPVTTYDFDVDWIHRYVKDSHMLAITYCQQYWVPYSIVHRYNQYFIRVTCHQSTLVARYCVDLSFTQRVKMRMYFISTPSRIQAST